MPSVSEVMRRRIDEHPKIELPYDIRSQNEENGEATQREVQIALNGLTLIFGKDTEHWNANDYQFLLELLLKTGQFSDKMLEEHRTNWNTLYQHFPSMIVTFDMMMRQVDELFSGIPNSFLCTVIFVQIVMHKEEVIQTLKSLTNGHHERNRF